MKVKEDMKEKGLQMQWADLSRYRSELMGFAMLAVLFFHVGGNHNETFFYCLSRCGNVGVDMFLFLSGVGLWFAWSKKPSLALFFKRRYVRVYPAWFVVACLYFVPLYVGGKMSLADTLLNVAVYWDFWTVYGELHFWYIPAVMALYTVAPLYMRLISRSRAWCWLPVVFMVFCLLMRYDVTLYRHLRHLEIFFSRIPIFLMGVNVGQWVKEKRVETPDSWLVAAVVFLFSAWACVLLEDGLRGRFPLFLERMVYIPLSVSMMLLLCRLFSELPRLLLRSLAFVGSVSLEFYLIHVEFVMKPLRSLQLGYWLTVLLTLAVTLPLSWLLHKAIEKVEHMRNKKRYNNEGYH